MTVAASYPTGCFSFVIPGHIHKIIQNIRLKLCLILDAIEKYKPVEIYIASLFCQIQKVVRMIYSPHKESFSFSLSHHPQTVPVLK